MAPRRSNHTLRKKRRKVTVTSSKTSEYIRTDFAKAIAHELKLSVILRTWTGFWKLAPRVIWTFYIEAFVVPEFRYEWDVKYRQWDAWQELLHHSNRISPAPDTPKGPDPKAFTRPLIKKTNSSSSRSRTTEVQNSATGLPESHDHSNCARLRFNVGGRMYETQQRTLQRFPYTLLGDPDRRLPFYDPVRQYYYLDRSRDCFENILYYYQSGGRLICPSEFAVDIFLSEVEFYDLGQEVLKNFQYEEGLEQEDENANIRLPDSLLQRKLWLLIEYPTSSAQAKIVSIISVYVIIISVAVFCIETEPMFREREGYWYRNNNVTTDDEYDPSDLTDPLAMIETICICWFTIEILLRFFVCPDKCKFLLTTMNIVDMLAIVPYVVNWGTKILSKANYKETGTLDLIRVIRLVRVFRIFKLSRHVKGLKILGYTLEASFNELGLLIFFLLICVILFSSALYFAEEGPDSAFSSIPDTFFWAVTTMTTVGYGDMVPVHNAGKIIGSICAITGVLTLALPVPVMVSNFNYFYNQEISRSRSISDRHDTNHVEMCCFLPGNGVHPHADDDDTPQPLSKTKSKRLVPFSKNAYRAESEGTILTLENRRR